MSKHTRLAMVVVLGLVGAAQAMPAQPAGTTSRQPGKPVRRGKPVKQPVIDLAKQAMDRRPGQVLPGDPPPEKFAAPMKAPATEVKPGMVTPPMPTPTGPSEEGKDGTTGRLIKPAPAPVNPDAGPRMAPKGAEVAKPEAQPATKPTVPQVPSAPEPAPQKPESDKTPIDLPKVAADDVASTPASLVVLRAPAGRAGGKAQPVYTWQNARVAIARVEGDAAGVQWRALGDGVEVWRTAEPGASAEGRFEIRTGLNTEVVVEVESVGGRVEVRVGRLSRVRVEEAAASGPAMAQRPSVRVDHGSVELGLVGGEGVETLMRSPDRSGGFTTNAGARVSYSAFRGTKVDVMDTSSRVVRGDADTASE